MTAPLAPAQLPVRPAGRGRSRSRASAGRARRLLRAGVLVAVGAALWSAWPVSLGGATAYIEVAGTSMLPTYHPGDLVITRSRSSYQVGNPVVYRVPRGEVGAGQRVVHRIVGGDGSTGYQMRGDHNAFIDPWVPHQQDMVGRVVLRVPVAGVWMAYVAHPLTAGILCGSLTVVCLLWPRQPSATGRRASRASRRV
jgi:signal peptidase I